jgi:hypothetical protein
MSRRDRSFDKLPPFVPLFRETLASPAYRQLSFGARALFTALRGKCVKNNGHVYLSQREVGRELGYKNRSSIANWYRELQHYGFIVQTEAAALGVDGKGKAPHWRITDMRTRKDNNELAEATKDFLRWDGVPFDPHVAPSRRWDESKRTALEKQNPGLHVRTTVDSTSVPRVDCTSVPLRPESGTNGESISVVPSGTDGESISILATSVTASGAERRRRGGRAA